MHVHPFGMLRGVPLQGVHQRAGAGRRDQPRGAAERERRGGVALHRGRRWHSGRPGAGPSACPPQPPDAPADSVGSALRDARAAPCGSGCRVPGHDPGDCRARCPPALASAGAAPRPCSRAVRAIPPVRVRWRRVPVSWCSNRRPRPAPAGSARRRGAESLLFGTRTAREQHLHRRGRGQLPVENPVDGVDDRHLDRMALRQTAHQSPRSSPLPRPVR